MLEGISITVSAAVRCRLETVVADRNSAQKHVWRAQIILLSAAGLGTMSIMRETGKSKTCVWRWQERFMQEGVAGLLHDKTRPSRIAPLPLAKVEEILALTKEPPLGEATHWTGSVMAKAVGVSLSSVQRVWRSHGLQPHRWRLYKVSNDPAFADKNRDIVGLYMDPPAHAVVLSVDEKSQIQALDELYPKVGDAMKKGRCGIMTHDYKRNGTTTLFAALSVLDGRVIGRNMQRYRHQEFIRFLKVVERDVPAGKTIHAILDNYATHKHPKVIEWLGRHPRWPSISPRHRVPGSISWRDISPSSPNAALNAASSTQSLTSRPPSTDLSTKPMTTQNHSFGPKNPTKSSLPSDVGTKR